LHANAACATVPPIRPATALIGEETAVRWERRRIVLEEESMRSTIRARAGRTLAIVALIGATLAPAASSVHAADSPLILKVGTDQTFSGLNPWQAVYVLDYEIFTLNYDLLVGYDQNLDYTEGFATSWTTSEDGKTTTFKIRPGMKWSDGQPATAEDAAYTYNFVLDALAKETTLGSGYLDGYISSAGVTKAEATDPETLVVTTETPTPLLLAAYVPILPKHIWSKYSLDQIANAEASGFFANDPPVVGTGPYQVVEYDPGKFARFERNPNYWGKQGAADQIIITHFDNNDTMSQALRNGELDYARGMNADAFDALKGQPNIVAVEGAANGYSYLTFNGYPKAIKDGGSSTRATADPAFRDALAWGINLQELVDKVLAGHGTPGTSLLPPFQSKWYVPPDPSVLRGFDLAKADEKLTAAGYVKDASGNRLDKEGKPINLRMTWPSSESELATAAQFITGWWGQLGIKVTAGVTEDNTLLVDLTPPEYDPPGKADFDTYMWGWVGDVDPSSLLEPFTTDQIGGSSDTFWSNARFDELFKKQGQTIDETERKGMLKEMQELFYKEVPNIPLYYDSELHGYRTDRFGGWQNQPPDGGTPLFQFGPIGYLNLTDATAVPSPSASEAAPSAGASATAAPGDSGSPTSSGGANTGLLLALGAVVVVAIAGTLVVRRRGTKATEEE
jgi:peptide/nickel transport system substrate-binding protein